MWWNEEAQRWQTGFPPPPGFAGAEEGEFGDDDYVRDLAPDEEDLIERVNLAGLAEERAEGEAERDAWFAFARTLSAPPSDLPEPPSHRASERPPAFPSEGMGPSLIEAA